MLSLLNELEELEEYAKALHEANCAAYLSCPPEEVEVLGIALLRHLGHDDEFSVSLCKAIMERFWKDGSFPHLAVTVWAMTVFAQVAKGKKWAEAIRWPESDMQVELVVREVEKARRAGMATSRNGEPGPAFVAAAQELGITPEAARSAYYRVSKDEQQRIIRAWDEAGEIARILCLPPEKPRHS